MSNVLGCERVLLQHRLRRGLVNGIGWWTGIVHIWFRFFGSYFFVGNKGFGDDLFRGCV